MAMTQAKLDYFREYQKTHPDEKKAAFSRWHEAHGANRYYENLELTRAIKRKSYYASKGDSDGAAMQQELIDHLRLSHPRKQSGSKTRLTAEERLASRQATMRKMRYGHIKGIPTFYAPDKCDICGSGGKICMDHDHTEFVFRGWLCNDCNLAIGRAKEDVNVLKAMIAYLEKHKGGR